jgi:8-oxo-dGTP pyrophosphatase MutT (NUDIX family)
VIYLNQGFAYGGIVFNEEGKVLMRSPTGNWGGYVWTFAKGGSDEKDKSREETAIREVQEETGYECSILVPIPGEFESDTCITKYFLMELTGIKTDHDKDTQEVKWVDVEEAFEMIKQTKSLKGRNRDRNALESAIRIRDLLKVNSGSENVI